MDIFSLSRSPAVLCVLRFERPVPFDLSFLHLCSVSSVCRTSSALAPPPTHGRAPSHSPPRCSLPPHCSCPAPASMRPPLSTTRQRGPCTTSMTRAVGVSKLRTSKQVHTDSLWSEWLHSSNQFSVMCIIHSHQHFLSTYPYQRMSNFELNNSMATRLRYRFIHSKTHLPLAVSFHCSQ